MRTSKSTGIDPALYDAQISYGMTETMMCGEINGSWGAASKATDPGFSG